MQIILIILGLHHRVINGCPINFQPTDSDLVFTWYSEKMDPLIIRSAYFDWKYVERPLLKHRSELFIMDSPDDIHIQEDYISPELDVMIPTLLKIDNFSFWQQLFVSFSNHYDVMHLYSRESSLEV